MEANPAACCVCILGCHSGTRGWEEGTAGTERAEQLDVGCFSDACLMGNMNDLAGNLFSIVLHELSLGLGEGFQERSFWQTVTY